MVGKLAPKADRTFLWVVLLLALVAGSLPAGATIKQSWDEVTAVNRKGLEAAARKYLSLQEEELLEQAISKEDHYSPRHKEEFKPPLVRLKQRGFMRDLIDIVKPCLARGDSAKVKQFFQDVNQQKLIRGYGQYYRQIGIGWYGGPMVIQLELRQSPQKEFLVEVWYRLVHPVMDGKKQEGPRRTYPTGITAP
jgi:hypothetical protein